jgi:hypothetical protein
MTKSHCDRLDEYLAGALPGHYRADFEAHLADCQPCRQAAADWLSLCGALSAETDRLESPSRALLDRLDIAPRSLEDREHESPRNDCESDTTWSKPTQQQRQALLEQIAIALRLRQDRKDELSRTDLKP